MVLVTTAIEKTFPKDKNEKILFLGEWCKLYSKKDVYEQYEHKTLSYHWDDREKLYEDTKYIDKIYEKYLEILKDNLNKIHGVDFSISYWRIILGPWLRYFIEIVYDRYLSILEVSKKNIDYTIAINLKDEDILPSSMDDFNALYKDDLWNHYIYKNIISFFNIKIKNIEIGGDDKIVNKKEKICLKDKIKKFSFFINKFNKVHFFSSYINLGNLWALQIKLGQIPTLGTTINLGVDVNCNAKLRESLIISNTESLFEKILISLLKKQIPKYYLESYKEFRLEVLKKYPKNAKVIFTANAYSSDDAFKFWTAEKKEEGTKYIIGQHGGHYGMGLFSSHEEHQIKSADNFFSWGWDNKYNKKIVPVSAVKLIKNINYNPNGDILIPLSSFPRYSCHIMAMPIDGQVLNYIDDQVSYLISSSDNAKKLLKLRIYQHDYKWNIKERFIDKGCESFIESDINLNKSFYDRLSECRLCISTYNATTYLETFSANYPTLLYWNPLHWELRDEAKPYFDLIESAGILHYTPKSLVLKLNEIYQDPLAWWSQEKVQTAKNKFCNRFANKDNDFLVDYKREIAVKINETIGLNK